MGWSGGAALVLPDGKSFVPMLLLLLLLLMLLPPPPLLLSNILPLMSHLAMHQPLMLDEGRARELAQLMVSSAFHRDTTILSKATRRNGDKF